MDDKLIEKTIALRPYESFLEGMGKYVWSIFLLFILVAAIIIYFYWRSHRRDMHAVLTFSGWTISWEGLIYSIIYICPIYPLYKNGLLKYLPHPVSLYITSFIMLLLCGLALGYLLFNNGCPTRAFYTVLIVGSVLGLFCNALLCGNAFLFFPTIVICFLLTIWGHFKYRYY